MQNKKASILNNHPLISIGIPTYNRPKGLNKLLNSLEHQTYSNFEVLIGFISDLFVALRIELRLN